MDNNYTQIESYLHHEMNEAERMAFENRLKTDKDFLKEFTVQEQLTRVAINTGIKNEFGKAIKRKVLTRQLMQAGIIIAIAAAAFLLYAIKNNWFSGHPEAGIEKSITGAEKFSIDNSADTIIETRDGVVFAIPANAFGTDNKTVEVEIKTALDAAAIIQNGLSTTSNGALLQTAGMFYINGYSDGQQLSLVKDIAVSVPAQEINPGMQLFDGVEDKDGNINWVNPKPVEKNLRTYDITTLDFYPPDYIPTLKVLDKNYTDKRYTDSLYYSFAGYPATFFKKDTVVTRKVETLPMTDTAVKPEYKMVDTSKYFDYNDTDYIIHTGNGGFDYLNYEIDPARIKAIWNKKFNNTIIATKEFEERLQYIHGLCDQKYLAAYLEGLNKPLHEIDKAIADNSSGDIKKKFVEFAARKDGKVIIAEGMQQQLSNYFQKKYEAYQQAAIKTRSKYEGELNRLNTIADAKKREQSLKDLVRENENFQQEFCINLADAYQQIGIKRSCNDTIIPPATPYYNTTINTTGWKNLDIYVFDATENRQSMTYTDPATGKIATLTYSEVTIQVENLSEYDKVLVYLLPDSLNSFQRVGQNGNLFKEKLNSLFKYDAVAIGYKKDKVFYANKKGIQPGSHQLRFSPQSEGELKKELNQYSKQVRRELQLELEYQLFAQQEQLRQVKILDDRTFMGNVGAAIFKCWMEGEGTRFERAVTPK